MNARDTLTSLLRQAQHASARLAVACFRRPVRALLLTLAACVLALVGAASLKIETDLARLLPDSFESVQSLGELERRFGSTGSVTVVLRGDDPEALRDYADQVAPRLAALPAVRFVDHKRPVAWFEERGLYFVEEKELAAATDRLEERVDWEILHKNPMYVDLEESAAPELELDRLKPQQGRGPLSATSRGEYYEDVTAGLLVLFAKPAGRSTDLGQSGKTLAAVRQVLEADPQAPQFELTGRVQKKLDQKAQLQRELGLSTWLSLGLVAAYLLLHFGSLRALLLLGAPQFVGILLMLGAIGFTYGSLNILTAFVGVMLLGLGIDHGIHLLEAYEERRAAGDQVESAIQAAFGHTGRAVLAAALTTATGFASLAISEFRAFREFGVAASLGMVFITLAYLVVLPALLHWLPDNRRSRRALPDLSAWPRSWLARPKLSAGIGLAVCATLLLPLRRIQFDYDFAALEDGRLPSMVLDKQVNEVLGHSQTPTVVLTDSLAQERQVAARLREGMAQRGSASTIDLVGTLDDAVPSGQRERLPLLRRIRAALDRIPESSLSEHTSDVKRVREMANAAPFTRSDLPAELTRLFGQAGDNTEQGAVLVYPAISLSDGARVPEFAAETRSPADGARVAGDSMVMADILQMVKKDGGPVLLAAAACMLLALLALLGNAAHAALALTAGGLSVAVAVGLHTLLGHSLNYLNIVMIPVLFGIAMDGTVHWTTSQGRPAAPVWKAIAGSLATTAFGFGALLVATHPGVRSIAELALVGLSTNALVSLVLVPALLNSRISPRRGYRPAEGPIFEPISLDETKEKAI